MRHLLGVALRRRLMTSWAGMSTSQPQHTRPRRWFGLSVGILGSWLLASIAVCGCGNPSENTPYDAGRAKTVSAKYKELHPEEFPVAKAKGTKKRRGG